MAHFLKAIKIEMTDMKAVPEYDKYKDNFVTVDSPLHPSGSTQLYSTPESITMVLTPDDLAPVVSTAIFWPFTVSHNIVYGLPGGMSERRVMDRLGYFHHSSNEFVGKLWLTTKEYEELSACPTQDKFNEIIQRT